MSLTKGSISGGSNWNGGTITGNLTISKSSPGIALSGSGPYMWFGSYWKLTSLPMIIVFTTIMT